MKMLYPVLILCLFASCSQTKRAVVKCYTGALEPYGLGFDSTDFDSSFVFRFKNNSAFDSVIDSATILPLFRKFKKRDTCDLSIYDTTIARQMGISATGGLTPGYDYCIFLPATGKKYLITDITLSGITTREYTYTKSISFYNETGSSGPPECYNNVVSCKINGVKYSAVQSLGFSGANIYFPK